jgi:hypothetical protein
VVDRPRLSSAVFIGVKNPGNAIFKSVKKEENSPLKTPKK